MSNLPTTERVFVAWLKDVISYDGVATVLPSNVSTWASGVFVQVTTVGGSPDIDVPIARPVVQVDVWAANTNSSKPPWGRANEWMERVRDALYTLVDPADVIDPGTGFATARVLSAYPLSEPRRVLDDTAGYARFTMDVQVHWVKVS